MTRWILKIAGGLLIAGIATLLCLIIPYSSWISSHRHDLATGSEIASTALGDIEYATAGSGTPVLRIHGSPGGYDAVIAGPRARPEGYPGLQIIGLSRPGYLRTPLSSGRTPAEQADLYAALLDKLNIKKVIVYAVSGGGPSAVQFAIRHSDRTMGLVMVIPLLQSKPESVAGSSNAVGRFAVDFSWWLGGQLMTTTLAPRLMKGFDANDPYESAQLDAAVKSFVPADLHEVGRENDKVQWQNLGIESWPLERIAAPTLIVHGDADENAPYAGSANAAKRIPGATLITIKGGDHLIIVSRAREIHEAVQGFMAALPQE